MRYLILRDSNKVCDESFEITNGKSQYVFRVYINRVRFLGSLKTVEVRIVYFVERQFSHSERLAVQFSRQIIIASVFHLVPFYFFRIFFSYVIFTVSFCTEGAFRHILNCIITSRTLLRLRRFSLYALGIFLAS